MISLKMTSKGRKTMNRLLNGRKDFRKAVKKGWHRIGNKLKVDIVKSIENGPKTGRIYRIYIDGTLVLHQASARGQAPANMFGLLKTTIEYKVQARGRYLKIGAGSREAPYALWLEEGVKNDNGIGWHIAPRPFVIKAINANNALMGRYLRQEIRKAFRGGL